MMAPADGRSPRLVVLGAGVSGLAAAFAASREAASRGIRLRVEVLERKPEVGGRASSATPDGWLMEAGPSGYLDSDPEVARLVEEVGLQDRVVRAGDAASRRYVLADGRLHEVGPNPLRMVRSGLIGAGGLLRLLGEVFVRPRTDADEESVRDFAARRFGESFADRIVRTAMLGIFAGDAERLSLDACFPELRALEREHGSVIRGAIARRRRSGGETEENRARPGRKLTSYRSGLRELPRALAAREGIAVRTSTTAVGLRRSGPGPEDGGWLVEIGGGGPVVADAVVVATPTLPAARILEATAPRVAEELAGVPSPPVAVVALGYAAEDTASLPEGFGALVSRGERVRMLGSLWESQIYPDRAPAGHVLVRVMYGGRVDPEIFEREDAELVTLAAEEMAEAFGVGPGPRISRVFRWPRAIPQYELGHVARVERVRRELQALPGLFLAGDALDGVSFVKSAATGLRQGEAAADYLVAGGSRSGADDA